MCNNCNSTISITLSKEIDTKEKYTEEEPGGGTRDVTLETSPHNTEAKGDGVEKYHLTIVYSPDYDVLTKGQGGEAENESFQTGIFATMYQGAAAGTETSRNNHQINVYTTDLDVLKTDESGTLLEGVVFKLYEKDDINGTSLTGMTGKYSLVATGTTGDDGVASLETENGLKAGVTYYLVEDKAPENYIKLDTVWTVQVQTESGKYTDLDGRRISSKIYPFNWDQGARILVDGKAVDAIIQGAEAGETEKVTNGYYVSNKAVISFRHEVVNKNNRISLTVNKTWEDEDNPPDSVTVELYRVSKAGHTWGEWTIVPSTCAAEGVREHTCTVCGEKETHVIEKSSHTPGEPHKENEVASTCTEAGGYDMVVRCSVCNAIITSEHTALDLLPHTPGEAIEEIHPGGNATDNCEEAGCYDEVVYCTVCNTELSREHHADHDWGDWVIVNKATNTTTGLKRRVCKKDNSHVQEEVIPILTKTTINYRMYEPWYSVYYWKYADETPSTQYDIGSTITISWTDVYNYKAVLYKNLTPSSGDDGWGTYYYFNNMTGENYTRTRTGSGWGTRYNYSITTTVTSNMVLDIVASDYSEQSKTAISTGHRGRIR